LVKAGGKESLKINPLVKRHVATLSHKKGKGFSRGELVAAGLSVQEARRLGLYVDERRRSSLEQNVQALKGLSGQAGAA